MAQDTQVHLELLLAQAGTDQMNNERFGIKVATRDPYSLQELGELYAFSVQRPGVLGCDCSEEALASIIHSY